MSNSHSGALLASIDRTASLGSSACSSAGVGGSGGGDVATTSLVILFTLALVAGSLGNGLGVLLVLVDGPVKHVIVLETLTDEEIAEDLAQVRIIRLVIETQGTGVVQVDGKLVRETTAQDLGGSRHLLLHDTVVLLLLGSGLESLPGEGSTAEVEHDITKGLHVITAGLLCRGLARLCNVAVRLTYRHPGEC